MDQEQRVNEALQALNISFEVHRHRPVYTVEEAEDVWAAIPGQGCKNLFLRDAKGERHFLVVVPKDKRVDIKALGAAQDLGRLSFGSPDRLMRFLGLEPGAVSPFGILNDPQGLVTVMVDQALLAADRVTFHPNVNTATLALSVADFKRFLESRPSAVRFIAVPVVSD